MALRLLQFSQLTLTRLCWILKKKKKDVCQYQREHTNILWTTYFPFPPSRTEQLLSLGSMVHRLFVSLLTALPTVYQGSQLFVALVISPNSLWTPRGKKSTLFTLAAPWKLWLYPLHGGQGEALTNACWSRKNVVDDWSACSSPEKPMESLSLLVRISNPHLLSTNFLCFPHSQLYRITSSLFPCLSYRLKAN